MTLGIDSLLSCGHRCGLVVPRECNFKLKSDIGTAKMLSFRVRIKREELAELNVLSSKNSDWGVCYTS